MSVDYSGLVASVTGPSSDGARSIRWALDDADAHDLATALDMLLSNVHGWEHPPPDVVRATDPGPGRRGSFTVYPSIVAGRRQLSSAYIYHVDMPNDGPLSVHATEVERLARDLDAWRVHTEQIRARVMSCPRPRGTFGDALRR